MNRPHNRTSVLLYYNCPDWLLHEVLCGFFLFGATSLVFAVSYLEFQPFSEFSKTGKSHTFQPNAFKWRSVALLRIMWYKRMGKNWRWGTIHYMWWIHLFIPPSWITVHNQVKQLMEHCLNLIFWSQMLLWSISFQNSKFYT